MAITRRGWIGASAALAAGALTSETVSGEARAAPAPATARASAPVAPANPQWEILSTGTDRDYGAAMAALADYARAELDAYGLPGMTLSICDVEGFTATLALGWADREAKVPLTTGHVFQIGSITKSFVAQAVLALAERGAVDLDAPVSRYLPDLPLPPEPITVAQLLSHTAGLPDAAPLFPRTPDGRLWCGFAPGSRFSYSNTGYVILGKLIERVSGLRHPLAVRRLVRERIGVEEMAATISQANRAEFAVGLWPWDETAASRLPLARLETAYWTPEDTAAGCLGATPEQMAIYLRAILRMGRGEPVPVLSKASAQRFLTPVIAADEFGPGARYALGVALQPVDGVDCVHHTGGMMAFSSSFHADPAAGVACFASVNARLGDYRPRQTTAFAIRLLRAARAGAPLPAAPDPLARHHVKTPEVYVGRYVSSQGEIELQASANGLRVKVGQVISRVSPDGPDRLLTDHRVLARYGLDVVRQDGAVTGLWWGPVLFTRDAAAPPPAPAAALAPFAGVYLNRDPWVRGREIHVRGGDLVAEGVGRLVDRGGWWSAAKDTGGVERLRFDAVVDGKAQRLNVSGDDLLRLSV